GSGVGSGGKDVRLLGPHVATSWLGDRDKVRLITALRLFDTALRDDVFSLLAPAEGLEILVIGSKGITGAGLEKLPGNKLHRLSMRNTGAHDGSLKGIQKFRQLQELQLQETSVTSRVLKH